MPLDHPLLTIEEVCALLRASRATVYRLMRSRQLRYTHVGADRRVRMEDLEEYLLRAENTRQSA